MSWTNQKPFVITTEMLAAPWSGYRDGRTLRCEHCGEFLLVGMAARFVLSPGPVGNFFVCAGCDGDDIAERMLKLYKEGVRRFWFMMDRERLLPHPEVSPEQVNRAARERAIRGREGT